MLLEVAFAVMLMLAAGVWVFRTNMDSIRPRQWAMIQALTDAFMTAPHAQAESIDFDRLVGGASPYPIYPNQTTTTVTIGTLPSGTVLTGTLITYRQASENNLASAGGTGDTTTNPARVESWLIESHLIYTVNNQEYVKSRSSVRTR